LHLVGVRAGAKRPFESGGFSLVLSSDALRRAKSGEMAAYQDERPVPPARSRPARCFGQMSGWRRERRSERGADLA
jgi:hypothetical protein